MKLGETGNGEAVRYGRPLDGVRVLALEQMQALPFGTNILAQLGAEVVKLEALPGGDASRGSQPAMLDRGQPLGHTFLRYNLGKKSIGIDIRSERGRDLVLDLAPHFDVVCENLGPGRAARFGLGYAAMAKRSKRIVYLSVSGFGETGDSPYKKWPAYAPVPEAMCGAYEYSRRPNQPPVLVPMAGLGDSATGLFGVIGVLAALRHRDAIGEGQYIDMAMYDAMLALTDLIPNYWSLGLRKEPEGEVRNPSILSAIRCRDGWLVLYVTREHQFERLARFVERPDWLTDPRLATRTDWNTRFEELLRPAIEAWAAPLGKQEAARRLAEAGIAAAPCNDAAEVISDPHVAARRMLVEVPRTDGGAEPVLVGGTPLKMSKVAEKPEGWYPGIGEHTDALLRELLKLGDAELRALREAKVISPLPAQ
jgi:crotonobetainyl-CoA:carnitine CoA-transferase CaiB-like acyl-CoA transferase